MKKIVAFSTCLVIFAFFTSTAQKITYSEPDREDLRSISYDIIGKINDNFLVYKSYRDNHFIAVYDEDMKVIAKMKMTYLPDRILSASFIQYPGFFYMIYQYQKRNIVYCMGVKLDDNGKLMNDPIQLDTTGLGFGANSKIYSVVNSEDKQKIMIFKINTREERVNYVTTLLFDKSLTLLHKSRLAVPIPGRNNFLSEFMVDNEGDMACLRAGGTAQSDNVSQLSLLTKTATSDSFNLTELNINGLYLDDIRLKADNFNKHYLVTSFYSKQKRGNVDGLYTLLWDKYSGKKIFADNIQFNDQLRAEARTEGSLKSAFNDYFVRNIIMKKNGGFIISAEAAYTSSRGNAMNRWDYMYNSPYYSPLMYGNYNSFYGSPFSYYYPWSGYNNYNINRYYADNITILSFDANGKVEWSNVIPKSQFDDNSDDFIGYGLMNSGDQIHFLFNIQDKRQLIFSDQSITPDGQLVRLPTLKGLDKGYDFMPRQMKQTGIQQFIIPCEYRNYVCFAKVEF